MNASRSNLAPEWTDARQHRTGCRDACCRQKAGTRTTTSALLGLLRDDPARARCFLLLVRE